MTSITICWADTELLISDPIDILNIEEGIRSDAKWVYLCREKQYVNLDTVKTIRIEE